MQRIAIVVVLAMLVAGAVWFFLRGKSAPPPPASPAEEYAFLLKEYNAQFPASRRTEGNAQTEENTEKYSSRFLQLAKENPKEPFAVDALLWILQRPANAQADEAMDLVARDFARHEKVAKFIAGFTLGDLSPQGEKFLKTVLEKSPDRAAQARACFVLAVCLNKKGATKEAEEYFEMTATKYGDALNDGEKSLGDVARVLLFEIQHLAVGKVAPEIEGEDIDGKRFKLSDYRGKVVLLDFWGNW